MEDTANPAAAAAAAPASNILQLQPSPGAAQLPPVQTANGGIDTAHAAPFAAALDPPKAAVPANRGRVAAAPPVEAAAGLSLAPDAAARQSADRSAALTPAGGDALAAAPGAVSALAAEPYSSDSEGSLPEIDSGASDGGGSTDDDDKDT